MITTVKINNFLGIEHLTLNLQTPINFVVGYNEAGKSSLRDAILWGLTGGQTRGLKTHQEQAALIRNDAKTAEVSITWRDGRTVTRRKTPKSPATLTGNIPETNLSPDILCDPYVFLSLPENQRRELLFRLIPGLN
jgi:DNA repair exonuclease SbcCD ATPase subunit